MLVHISADLTTTTAKERAMTEVMTIRQMCDAYDVTPRTLRFYEAKELLFPIREGTRRLFTRRDRARLTLILRGKRFGFSLEEIRQLLDLYDADPSHMIQIKRTLEVARERLDDMIARREALGEAIDELREQIALGEERLKGASNAA